MSKSVGTQNFSSRAFYILFISSIFCIGSFGSEPKLPKEPFNYARIGLPGHFLTDEFPARLREKNSVLDNDNTPSFNPVTNHGATLGRVLFYDKKLSISGTVSCSSCHQQEFGFADPKEFSVGFKGEQTRRHAMTLINTRFYKPGKFFWDERAGSLEEQVLQPFQDKTEMGLSLGQLVTIVELLPYYPRLFKAAYGDEKVTPERISLALAQFIRSIVSTDSKYDQGRRMVESPLDHFPNFSREENLGKELFMRRGRGNRANAVSCIACHSTEAFISPPLVRKTNRSTTSARNNGLDLESILDKGVFETTGNRRDTGKFKTPTLRNIAVTAPYMHDGRFKTLEEVVEHYDSGIKDHPNLHRSLRNPDTEQPVKFNLTTQQKAALVAFLKTLTDHKLLTAEKYSDPFKD